MKVKDIMTAQPLTCTPETNLAAAGALMLQGDCGVLPVVDAHGQLAGIVTDRDMCVALATRDKRASHVTVGEVARTSVITCGPEDDVHAALQTMKQHHVRRLPVEGFEHSVIGMLSMDDIVRSTGAAKTVQSEEVVDTLQTIFGRPHAALTRWT